MAGGVKVFAAATGTAASGVAAIGTAAIKSYADYEQLVGGVDTLFNKAGKSWWDYSADLRAAGELTEENALEQYEAYLKLAEGANIVQENASNAFKTAGMSANEYMETVTSFSASLISSLDGDTKAAALAADTAITDMSDNANKMGSSMESIQNAYQGFAKQNYTMLDNLKLGYGGTKTEMQRLLKDADAINAKQGKTTKYSLDNLADVYEAIHVVQTELGITGTTVNEASTTISGSLGMMKASWSNLLTGIADDSQDFDALIDNFVESVSTVAENILPRVEIALGGIGQLIEKLLPVIINRIPAIMEDVVPDLLQSGINMVSAIMKGIQKNLPQIADSAFDIAMLLVESFFELIPQFLDVGMQIIVELILGIAEAMPELIPAIVNVIFQIVNTLLDNIGPLVLAALQLMQALAEGIIEALPVLEEKLPEIVNKIVETLIEYAPQLLTVAAAIIMALMQGVANNLPNLLSTFISLVGSVVSTLLENAPQLLDAAWKFIITIAEGLLTYVPELLAKVPELVNQLVNEFLDITGDFFEVGEAIIDGIWKGISNGWDWLVGKVKEVASSLFKGAKEELEVNSPSRKFKWLAQMCVAGWNEGADGLMNTDVFEKDINAKLSTMKMRIDGARTSGAVAGYGNFYQTVNVNQPVSTPDEMARAMRLEARYGLVRGVPVG